MTHTAPLPLSDLKLLIVEDEYMIASDLRATLEKNGAHLVEMASGISRALSFLSRTRFDAAILDLNLAGELSTPVASALRTRKIPFVIMTGYGESLRTAPEFEGVVVIEKPVTSDAVARAVATAVSESS